MYKGNLLAFFYFISLSFCFTQKGIDQSSCHHKIQDAKILLDEEKFADLRNVLKQLAINHNKISENCKAEFYLLEGQVSIYNEDYETALLNLKNASKVFETLKSKEGMARVTFAIANANLDEGNYEEAAGHLDRLLEDRILLAEQKLLKDVLDFRSLIHSTKGEHDEAMLLIKESAQNAALKMDTSLLIQLYNQIATNYQTQGATDSAIYYFNKLIEGKKLNSDDAGLLSDYSTLGGLHQELANYEEAQTAFIEAIRYSEKLKDTLTLMSTYIDIANVYLEQRLLEPALEYTRKARQLAKEKGALLNEGRSLQLRATIFECLEQDDQALLNYQKAFSIYEKLGLKQDKADIQLRIAKLFGSNDNLMKAESSLRQALAIRLETGDKIGELNTKLALSDVLLKLGKEIGQVSKLLDEAFLLSQAVNDANALQETYKLRSILYERIGKPQEALNNYRKFNLLRDSIVNQDNAKIVRELEKRYETEKMNRKIAEQESEIETQLGDLKKRNTQIVQLIAGLLVLVIMVFLTIITYQRNKQFAKQKLSVIEKEKETEILRALVSGEEQERRRIARDLHDGLGALLATVKLRISALENKIPNIKNYESFQKAEELIEEASVNIREISHNMMPGSLSRYGLEVSLSDLCTAIEEANKIEVSFIPHELDNIVDDVVEINIYRIVQELLKNVLKHAEASEVIVQLSLDEGLINIIIEDDGKGFDPNAINDQNGIGFGSVKSRVLYLNGNLEIESSPGKGSSFNISIPYEAGRKLNL